MIAKDRSNLEDFEPFGDFDLMFSASKINLLIVEIPIWNTAREYGRTPILGFQHDHSPGEEGCLCLPRT